MSDERRYDDEEVARILDTAAATPGEPGRLPSAREGLTLAELQDIAREVGLSPERVARAAAALDTRAVVSPRRTVLGLPLGVGRMVDLPRAPTDREWELLVAELRRTFAATGKVSSHGSLREWTNGNLHAFVEPTADGYRLRMGTMKGNALAIGGMGLFGVAMGVLILLVGVLTGAGIADELAGALMLGLMGAGALGVTAMRLPAWARERERQMEYIAERALLLMGDQPEPSTSEPS